MKPFAKIIQITDLHIDVNNKVYGKDPSITFKACLREIERDHADAEFLIITGDFTHTGDVDSLRYLKEALSALPIPYFFVLGNHDSREALCNVIPNHPKDSNGFIQYKIETTFGVCLVLDSVKERISEGEFCEKRLQWLSQELEKASEPVIIFLHHPPCKSGIPAIDRLILAPESADKFFNTLKPYKENIRYMFMGHVHRPISGSWYGIPFSSLPSLSHQVALNLKETDRILGITEPAGYGVILVNDEQLMIHFKECGEVRDTIFF